MKRIFPYPYKAFLILAVAMAITSCTEVIEIELDSTYRRLVVFGTVTTDYAYHQVRLSTTSDYFSNQPSPDVSGALVEIETGDGTIRLAEMDSVPGLYRSTEAFRGIPGVTYRLHISQVDIDSDGSFESYAAESTMPELPRLDSIRIAYFDSPFVSGYQVFMYAMDPPGRDWYSFRIWKNGELQTDQLSDFRVQSDDFIDGTYIYGLPVGFLLISNPRDSLQAGDTVTLEMNSIGQDYFDFISEAQLEIFGNNPLFSGPPANVHSNIGNDGRGIFAAYSLKRTSVVVKP